MTSQNSQTHLNFLTLHGGLLQTWTQRPKPAWGPLLFVLLQGSGPAAELCTFRDQVIALFLIANGSRADPDSALPPAT